MPIGPHPGDGCDGDPASHIGTGVGDEGFGAIYVPEAIL